MINGDKNVNILLLSVGTRNKIIEYFQESIFDEYGKKLGNIVATDASKFAPAMYVADKNYVVPKINEKGYIKEILEICKKEKIDAVLSLIDPELNLLAENKDKFEALGVKIIGSDLKQCDISLDKMKMYEWLEAKGYLTAKTYTDKNRFYQDFEKGLISFPIFVKPKNGSASISINKVNDSETLEFLFEEMDDLIIQEFLNGQEIGADVYIDMITGEVVSIFTKKKLLMRAGETDKSVSFKDEKLFELIERFVKEFGYRGQIDIDIFEVNGDYYISEVNPRFGGGYPHAYEGGCNHIKMILNNLQGKANESNIGRYKENLYMMKYNEVLVKEIL